jgi:hypothetical protein
LSTFVRGTSNPAVYEVDNNVRRLIPDAQTVALLTSEQTVTTLTDAALDQIAVGPPLPSQADGALMTEILAHPTPRPVNYYMTAGQRRQIPDPATLTGLTSAGAKIQQVTTADIDTIPLGPPLPSRADGLIYKGQGKVYAAVMKGGKQCDVPDATTLRDAGFDFHTIQTIPAADLAQIPQGTPFPSTSHFLTPPSSSVPLVLLPVRLETRFQQNELWLRIYPDDIHVNSFEPELTADESTARTNFLSAVQEGTASAQAAFTNLCQQYGPERSAYIASADAQTAGTKPNQWNIAPFTNVLPERWIVIGYQGTAAGQVLATGPQIADQLNVGPDPSVASVSTDAGMRWISDFNTAIQAGMAFRIPLTAAQQSGFTRLVVLGLKSTLDPASTATRLADLFEAHHYTDGLELLPLDAPTNNTDDVDSAFSTSDPNFTQTYAVEQGPPLCPSRATGDGDRLASALGIPPTCLAHIKGADGGQDEQATAMNTVLWPATWGYYLEQLVTGAVPTPDTILPEARDHFNAHVRARGHFPIIRVGLQPYGILPVSWSSQWVPLEGRALDPPLINLLSTVRTNFENSVANVPVLSGATDPESALVSVLGMTPSSATFAVRPLIGPEYNFTYWSFVQANINTEWFAALTTKTLADTGKFSAVMSGTRLANATFVNLSRPLSDVVIGPPPLDGLPAPAYIGQLAPLGWQALQSFAMPPAPVPLLLLLLQYAALRQYADTAADLLGPAGQMQPNERLDAELIGISVQPRPTPWDILNRTLPGKGPVGTYLDGAKQDTTTGAFAEFWTAFNQLSTMSAADLDNAVREVMDLAAYRFDAWVSSFAHFRLDSLRQATPQGGIVIGAYGWLENVVPQPTATPSAGYIHAPSLAHATSAAVLRSGYLTHKNGSPGPFQIDLSSDSVRLGLDLLEGVRNGQSLGALLGYRFERTLHDTDLDQYIYDMRAIAPLITSSADEVVDGLALLRQFQNNPNFWSNTGLPPAGNDRTGLTSALNVLNQALDAVADLSLSESVHQLTKGNTIRSGSVLDAIASGDGLPPDLDIVQTPRSGTSFTHRILSIASGSAGTGWGSTPRAQAEPSLNAWAAALLGDPSRVQARAQYVDASRNVLASIVIPLNTLALSPLDLIALSGSSGMPIELASRLQLAAQQPTTVPATFQLLPGRDPSWPTTTLSFEEFLILVQSVAGTVAAARALQPADLVLPDDPVGAIDNAELQQRADAATSQLTTAQAALASAKPTSADLVTAANFGVSGALASLDPTQLNALSTAAATELNNRIQALTQMSNGFDRTTATPDAACAFDISRLTTIFGNSFTVLPLLSTDISANWQTFWGASTTLQGNDSLASMQWLQRMARVHSGAERLNDLLLYAEAVAPSSIGGLQVAQLPATANDRWIALNQTSASPTGRVSLVAYSPSAFVAGQRVAGLVIDQWVEVLPSTQQVTGVSFQIQDPTARAPQSILLVVPPDDFPDWTKESVEGSILDALDLAKLRAVDPDALGSLGHYLPALYFALNQGGPTIDTVSINFTVAQFTTA